MSAEPESTSFLHRLRPYALTGGRTRAAVELPIEALVQRTELGARQASKLVLERREIIDECARPLSIAELSVVLGVHLGVTRVLVGDMKAEGLLDVHRLTLVDDRPDLDLLERVLDGLKAI